MEDNQQHKNWWDEENKVIRLQVIGGYDDQDALTSVNKIAEIKQQFPGSKAKLLIDLTKATTPSSPARKIIAEKIYKDPSLVKIACVASSILVRTVNNFLIKASGISTDKIKVVTTEAEALKWLKK